MKTNFNDPIFFFVVSHFQLGLLSILASKISSKTAFVTHKNILDFLNINGSIVSLKQPNFVLTNSHFLQICEEKDIHKLTWPNLSIFFTTYCKYHTPRLMLIKCFKKSNGYVANLNRAKIFDLRIYYLSSFFYLDVPDVVGLLASDSCSTPTFSHTNEIAPEDVTALKVYLLI